MLTPTLLKTILTKQFKFTEKEILKAIDKATKAEKSLEDYLVDEGSIDEVDLYKKVADKLEVPFVQIKDTEISKETLNLVPAPIAQTHKLIAFKQSSDEIHLAMLDPEDIQTIEFLQRKTGLKPKVYLTTTGDMKDALRRYHADLNQTMKIVETKEGRSESGKDLKKVAEELPTINIVNSILEQSVYEGASDIHIEPTERELEVRYRVDGVLRSVMSLPKAAQTGVLARLKILANLKIDEHMVPQDGRFKIQVQDEQLSFRVSIIPVYDGEKVVMRLLREGQKPLTLEELGFLDKPKAALEAAMERPHGTILVTGPTGSGKTTTLYSVLGMLNEPGVNICTIEDPIEYHVKGINQSQVNSRVGFDFASGLRAFLRQDPDVIMVGEIRDQETAEIAIHAAMTGHLVLSTLHTNDAPTTLPRLADMGVPPFLLAFTMNIIVAQRLVRKLCEFCKEEYTLDKATLKELEGILSLKKILPLFKDNGLKLKPQEKTFQSMRFFRGAGCRRCHNSGYKGRVGIYEVLEMDKDMQNLINKRGTAKDIKELAEKKGMITMLQDGIIKAKKGVSSIEEILRATRD